MNFNPTLQLSPHFSLGEMTTTENRNLIEKNQIEAMLYFDNLQRLCSEVLEPVRLLLGIPIHVTSGFRCVDLNTAIGGSATSQHCHGEAADTVYGEFNLKEIFNTIAWSDVPYSQIIYEFGSWVHVGLIDPVNYPGRVGQRMTASRVNGATLYENITRPLI